MDAKFHTKEIPTKEIGLTGALLKKRFQRKLKAHKVAITIGQMSILNILLATDGITMQEISSKNCRDNSATTRIIDILERDGYVKRKKDPNDRRAFLIQLTSKGKKEVLKANEVGKINTKEATIGIDSKDLDVFMKVIKKIRQNITEINE